MDYEVLKPFKSVNRRFTPGDGPGGKVDAADDLSPHTIESLLARDFIAPKEMIALTPAVPPVNEIAPAAADSSPDKK